MDERLERQALNEALMRTVNERIAALDERAGWADPHERFEFRCECGREACDATVSMTLTEYERVRGERDRFAVAPGHEAGQIEQVVEQDERYLIVDKRENVEHLVE